MCKTNKTILNICISFSLVGATNLFAAQLELNNIENGNSTQTIQIKEQPNKVFNQNNEPLPPMKLPNSQQMPDIGKLGSDNTDMLFLLNAENARLKEMQKDLEEKLKIVSTPPQTNVKSSISAIPVNLSPGSPIPTIKIALNRPTSIVVADQNGSLWPVSNLESGMTNKKLSIARLDNAEGSMISVTPKEPFVNTVITLYLQGLNVPVPVELVSAQKEYDARADLRIMAIGPNQKVFGVGLPSDIDKNLLSVLYGAVENAKPLKTSSNYAQAWLSQDGKMYLRSKVKIMSPAFESMTASPDGTFAYKLPAVPFVTYKFKGEFGEIKIEGM